MAVFRPGTPDAPSPTLPVAAALALEPEAGFWAEACGWVPGSGHCGNRGCAPACLFAPQRAAEARRVARWRRLRRMLSVRRRAF
jgi:hypothetical protein